MAVDLRAAYLSIRQRGESSFPPECLEYVMRLILRLAYRGKGFRDLPPPELCRAFRTQVAEDFGAFADAALERFGIRCGDDLGRLVFLLAEQGCLTVKAGENRDQYAAAGPFRSAQA